MDAHTFYEYLSDIQRGGIKVRKHNSVEATLHNPLLKIPRPALKVVFEKNTELEMLIDSRKKSKERFRKTITFPVKMFGEVYYHINPYEFMNPKSITNWDNKTVRYVHQEWNKPYKDLRYKGKKLIYSSLYKAYTYTMFKWYEVQYDFKLGFQKTKHKILILAPQTDVLEATMYNRSLRGSHENDMYHSFLLTKHTIGSKLRDEYVTNYTNFPISH